LESAEDTRTRIIEAALVQVSLGGLNGLSLSGLAEAAGMSKSGLYAHFGSREGLELALVQAIVDRFRRDVWAAHEDEEPGEERLRGIVADWMKWVGGSALPGGCPITPVAAELDDSPGPARDLLVVAEKRWVKQIAREFAALRGSVRIAAADEQAAFELHNAIVGYGYFARFLGDADAAARFEVVFERLVAGAVGP